MALVFKKATKRQARLRLAFGGPPGSGKTLSSILVAKHLLGEPYKLPDGTPSRIVVLDTERNRSEKYADEFDFVHGEMCPELWGSRAFTDAIHQAEEVADVVICDSITHEWKACLAEVDRVAPKYKGNTWSAWSEVSPPHDSFIDAMMSSSAHVIATMRSKMATVQEKDDRGKTTVRKVGLESVQRDDLDYAFDFVLALDNEHTAIATKTIERATRGETVFPRPGKTFADLLSSWLNSGDPMPERARRPAAPAPAVEDPAGVALAVEFEKRIASSEGAALAAIPDEIKVRISLPGTRDHLKALYVARVKALRAAADAAPPTTIAAAPAATAITESPKAEEPKPAETVAPIVPLVCTFCGAALVTPRTCCEAGRKTDAPPPAATEAKVEAPPVVVAPVEPVKPATPAPSATKPTAAPKPKVDDPGAVQSVIADDLRRQIAETSDRGAVDVIVAAAIGSKLPRALLDSVRAYAFLRLFLLATTTADLEGIAPAIKDARLGKPLYDEVRAAYVARKGQLASASGKAA